MADNDGPIKKNALFIAGGVGYFVLGLVSVLFVTLSNRYDLDDLAVVKDLSSSPAPCGFAVPSLGALMTDLNFKSYPSFSGYRDTDASYERDALRGICITTTGTLADAAVARLWTEQPEQVNTDRLAITQLCHRAHVRADRWWTLTQENLQDPVSRIRRAYVRAQPAFAHYAANRDGGTNNPCDWSKDPFGDDELGKCHRSVAANAHIQDEISAAAQLDGVCGSGTLPTTNEMIFRLVALAVVANADREDNAGRCFANTDHLPVQDFCNTLTNQDCAAGAFAVPDGYAPQAPWETWTFPADAQKGDDNKPLLCNQVLKTADGAEYYPDETLRVRYELSEVDEDTGNPRYDNADQVPAAKEHCYRTHEYSSRSGEFLFGLPDIESAPSVHPVGITGDVGAASIDALYKPWFADVRNRPYTELKKSAFRDAIAFEGFRFGSAQFSRIIALYVASFWLGRGVMLCVGTLVPAFRRLVTGRGEVPQVRKPNNWTFATFLAVFFGIVAGLHARFVVLELPEASKTTCEEYQVSGRVFDSSSETAIRDYFAIIFLLFLSVFAIFWECLGRREPRKVQTEDQEEADEYRNDRGLSGILLLFFLCAVLAEALLCSTLAMDSGHALQDNVLFTDTGSTLQAQLDIKHLDNDIQYLHLVAFAHAAVIGVFTTLFAVAGPVANAKYFGLVLWLVAILAFIGIGWSRFAFVQEFEEGEDSGTRGATATFTIVVDIAFAVYAVYSCWKRWRTASTKNDEQDKMNPPVTVAQQGSSNFTEIEAEAPRSPRSPRQRFYDALTGEEMLEKHVSFDRLPLLALRPQR